MRKLIFAHGLATAALALAIGLSPLSAPPSHAQPAAPQAGSLEDLQQCVAVFGVTSAVADKTHHEEVKAISDKLFASGATKLTGKAGADALAKTLDNAKALMAGMKDGDAAARLSQEFVGCATRYPAE